MKKNAMLTVPSVDDYDLKKELKILKYLRKVSRRKTQLEADKLFELTGMEDNAQLHHLQFCMTQAMHIEGLEFEKPGSSGIILKNNLSEMRISDVGKEYLSNKSLFIRILDPLVTILEFLDFIDDLFLFVRGGARLRLLFVP